MCLCYAICKSSGMTTTAARRVYGFENMSNHFEEVEEAFITVQRIFEAIADLAIIEDRALMQSFGIEEMANYSSNESDATDAEESSSVSEQIYDIPDDLETLIRQYDLNWFQFIEHLQTQRQNVSLMSGVPFEPVSSNCDFDEKEMSLLKQSYLAFCAAQGDEYEQERTARAVNDEIVSESESDSPEAYINVSDPLSRPGKTLIAKKRMMIKRTARRRREKAIAEQHLLSRKVSHRANTILQKFPNIAETIEQYVQDHRVCADTWRRTGILTFDGNTKLKEKVTYEKIRQHLRQIYQHLFSYGTVIQSCVPRNKRRRSAERYLGVAKVTSRQV